MSGPVMNAPAAQRKPMLSVAEAQAFMLGAARPVAEVELVDTMRANGRVRRTSVYGESADMPRMYRLRLAMGQFFPKEEAENARPFVVLGALYLFR